MRPGSCVLGVNLIFLVIKGTLFVVVKHIFCGELRYWKAQIDLTTWSKVIKQVRESGKFIVKGV